MGLVGVLGQEFITILGRDISVQKVLVVVVIVVVILVVAVFIPDTVLVELVDEVGLVSAQRLLTVEPRNTLIPDEVDKIHFLIQL